MYFGPGISVGRRGISYGDSDAQAFISATGLTGTTEVNAVNNLVANLKTYGLWGKMKAIYPFVSDTVNLFNYSEDFTDGNWNKSAVTITGNVTTAPNGTNTADLIVPNTTSTNHIVFQAPSTFTTGISYTFSYYAKSELYTKTAIRIGGGGYATVPRAEINLTNGSIIYQQGFNALSVVSSGSGWYRIIGTVTAGTGLTPNIQPLSDSYSVVAENYVYSGNGTSGIYIWGAQLEQSASATTYQPIATTPANRFVSQFKYNLKDPRDLDAAFRLAFNGGWTYSKQGAKANGTSAYASTFFNGSLNQTTNSNAIGFYTNIANTSALTDPSTMGNVRVSDLNGSAMTASGTTLSTRLNNAPVVGTISNATGFFTATRQSATVTKVFSNSTQIATGNSGGVPINDTMLIANVNIAGAPYAAGYVSNQFTFAYMADGLSDSDVSNYYTSVQQFNQDLSRQVGVPIVSDADAQSFLNAAQITDLTQANAINTLVVGLKNASLWTKMKAIYPFVGGTATTHKWNLKDPRDLDAAYRLAFYGAWTHSSTGATPNGVNGYADTYYLESANATLNSGHISYYSRTNIAGNPFMGASNGTTETNIYPNNGGTFYPRVQATNSGVPSVNLNAAAYFIASRINATEVNGYRNTTKYTVSNPTVSLNNLRRYYLGAGNDSTIRYNANQTAFSTIGDGLNDSEASTLYTLVQNFQTTLGRQV